MTSSLQKAVQACEREDWQSATRLFCEMSQNNTFTSTFPYLLLGAKIAELGIELSPKCARHVLPCMAPWLGTEGWTLSSMLASTIVESRPNPPLSPPQEARLRFFHRRVPTLRRLVVSNTAMEGDEGLRPFILALVATPLSEKLAAAESYFDHLAVVVVLRLQSVWYLLGRPEWHDVVQRLLDDTKVVMQHYNRYTFAGTDVQSELEGLLYEPTDEPTSE